MKKFLFATIGLLLLLPWFWSCRDEFVDLNSDVKLTFSVDTLAFDTVFTTVGSATRSFIVFNNHNARVRISSISLGKGHNSFFRINVNGVPGPFHHDVEIAPNDSIFVFAEVTVNPLDSDSPLMVLDSLVFVTNSREQNLKLVAWGQDAVFLNANYPADNPLFHLISSNETWTSNKPIVLYSSVVVAPGVTLTVNKGARIHLFNNKSIFFDDHSTFKVNGSLQNPVLIQGTRLEKDPPHDFSNRMGQWGRIFFSPQSQGHEIHHAVIKNGTVGLQIGFLGTQSGSPFILSNSYIQNMSSIGIMVIESALEASNTVVSNCAEHMVYIGPGASASFYHCTLANFSMPASPTRQTASLLFGNYLTYRPVGEPEQIYHNDIGPVLIANSILYGSVDEEIGFELKPGSVFNDFLFDHCIVRTTMNTGIANFVNVQKNANPLFRNTNWQKQDYRLQELSPARGAGKGDYSMMFPLDIIGNSRTENFDLGAYNYYSIPEED